MSEICMEKIKENSIRRALSPTFAKSQILTYEQ